MSFKRAILLVVVVVFVGWIVLSSFQSKQLDAQVERLKRSKDLAKQKQIVPGAVPPPGDLVVAKVDVGDYWFVGKHEDGGGVEIPFRPGELPRVAEDQTPRNPNPGFVGPDQCKECHSENHGSFVSTAHYNTGRRVESESIDGSFESGSNVVKSKEPNLRFEMVRREDKFLQRVHFFDWRFEVPMEIIVGSSKMAQTYLYWHGDRLYQHNITHLTDGDQWINSPGFIDGDAAYARPVPDRCLDCHMTYFDYRGPPNHYTAESLILGVTCERCHGPGAEHVSFHRMNPENEKGHAIINPKQLERRAQMDVCGQCHGGSRDLIGEALRFRPGDRLDDHYLPPDDEKDARNSVHTSNQLTRLSQSQCFIGSEMTCIDCHDPHHNERGQAKLFSERCLKCHEDSSSCGFVPYDGMRLADNCIDCHMPRKATTKLRLQSIEGDVFPPLRDHLIKVDQQATDAYLQMIQSD